MTSDFNNIFSRFYLRVEDYKIAGLEEEIVKQMLGGYLRAAVSKPYMRRLFNSIVVDEDIEEVEFTMRNSWGEDEDQDFVEELLAFGMVVEWLRPKYNSVLNTSQFITNSDKKHYSQASHMSEIKHMLEKAQSDLRKYIRDRSYSLGLVNTE